MLFFFKQKTAYEMRISDWSSDVCSSDLAAADLIAFQAGKLSGRRQLRRDDFLCRHRRRAGRGNGRPGARGTGLPDQVAAPARHLSAGSSAGVDQPPRRARRRAVARLWTTYNVVRMLATNKPKIPNSAKQVPQTVAP